MTFCSAVKFSRRVMEDSGILRLDTWCLEDDMVACYTLIGGWFI